MDIQTTSFNSVHLWIQLWNLPPHWISKETGMKFKNLFANMLDVLIPESGSKKGRFLKILAEVNLDKSLLKGSKIHFNGQEVWADFKYEHLATFCFYCGRVGHFERACSHKLRDAKEGKLLAGQYGDWLKAEQPKVGNRAHKERGQGREQKDISTP